MGGWINGSAFLSGKGLIRVFGAIEGVEKETGWVLIGERDQWFEPYGDHQKGYMCGDWDVLGSNSNHRRGRRDEKR